MLIRAKDSLLNNYIYIYSIYLSKNGFDETCWYFLCSSENKFGLNVFTLDEIKEIEILDFECQISYFYIDNEIVNRIRKNNWSIDENLYLNSQNQYMHPVLKYFLDNQWEVYEGIIEGQIDDWREFEKKLGFRP
ncbi:hypothetical protein SAMN02745664_1077 [Moraxella cuniculi DSM 21768]|uniref:Uncharacterized protein n=1 Tax=Moraxella cuniculi DSM 21768 TaxID=1122245 RepID=A0A1N7ERH2_9GAMM|nr:hypothetical protein [Moraxella cuniculi]OOS06294.1 hypothetical protein B0189_05225 [Moraxella cuniculi]SIR90660.1 hypothetical protein SAMN02745664_1077 [Moraxella cuniculi DSM 21768]